MYPDRFGGILEVWSIISFFWLVGLSLFLWKGNLFLKKLFPKQGKTFKDKLEEVLKEIESLEDFKRQSLEHIQKMTLKRYNPYQDTGGDQSFSAALLDGKGNGVVLTSLHSRAGTRVFAKPVKEGREEGFKFSEEEQEVVNQAKTNV